MSEKTRNPQANVVPVDALSLNMSMQMPLAEFAAQYNVQKPHTDIARMDMLFTEIFKKKSSRSSFDVFPIHAESNGAPVRLARTIDKNAETGSSLLDEGESTTYYIFVGNTSELAFAQINQNSSKWGQINKLNQIEELNDENLATIDKILTLLETQTRDALDAIQRAHDAKMARIKQNSREVGMAVGSIALVGVVLFGAVAGVRGFFRWGATNEREEVENFDNAWGGRSLGTNYAPVDQLQKVETITPDDLLQKAPGFGVYDGSLAGPRRTYVSDSSCSTTSNVAISPTDKISVVTMEPTKTNPISYYADSTNDKIIFCSFGGGSSKSSGTPVYFEVHAQ